MDSKKIAFLVKKRRKELGIRQDALASLSGISIRKISDIETASGETTVGTLEKILEVLGMEMLIRVKVMDNEI